MSIWTAFYLGGKKEHSGQNILERKEKKCCYYFAETGFGWWSSQAILREREKKRRLRNQEIPDRASPHACRPNIWDSIKPPRYFPRKYFSHSMLPVFVKLKRVENEPRFFSFPLSPFVVDDPRRRWCIWKGENNRKPIRAGTLKTQISILFWTFMNVWCLLAIKLKLYSAWCIGFGNDEIFKRPGWKKHSL